MNGVKKIFGGIELTWTRLIVGAIISGIFTGIITLIPELHYTSLIAITQTLEVWIPFGIFIIMNSKSNKESALKCFIFFLISQPIVYLVQVPFNQMGWGLFAYYPYWFIWTILCLPMGYIGYFMKQDKWWGYIILLPLIIITASSYHDYFAHFQFYMPRFILICLFCACAMIMYPLIIFNNKKIKIFGALVGAALAIILSIVGIVKPPIYSIDIITSSKEYTFNESYKASLEDKTYGNVEIKYFDDIENYTVHAEFKKAGHTILKIESPDGEKKEYDLDIEIDTYTINSR